MSNSVNFIKKSYGSYEWCYSVWCSCFFLFMHFVQFTYERTCLILIIIIVFSYVYVAWYYLYLPYQLRIYSSDLFTLERVDIMYSCNTRIKRQVILMESFICNMFVFVVFVQFRQNELSSHYQLWDVLGILSWCCFEWKLSVLFFRLACYLISNMSLLYVSILSTYCWAKKKQHFCRIRLKKSLNKFCLLFMKVMNGQ